MAGMATEDWVKFFRDAGIPAGIAADYAITFNNNRIQRNMLLDLNKEILKDMGISLMGDVISILRHAKAVHEKAERERILAGGAVSKKSSRSLVSESPSKSRRHSSNRAVPKESASPLSSPRQARPSLPKKRTAPTEAENLREVEGHQRPEPMEVDGLRTTPAPPVKKSRRVLPEHEGGYRITMPSGSTPRSRAILSMAARQSRQKTRGTVFDRLGECIVSSTTNPSGDDTSAATTSTLTVTSFTTSSTNKDGSSVFSRLGNKAQMIPKQPGVIVRLPKGTGVGSGQLQYAGVLKKDTRSPMSKAASKKNGTMRADEETGNAKDRLGLKRVVKDGVSPEPTVVRRIMSRTGKESAGILGNPENATTRSVKTRLGVTIPGARATKPTSVKLQITGPSNVERPMQRFSSGGFRSTTYVRPFRPRGGGSYRGRGRGGYNTFNSWR